MVFIRTCTIHRVQLLCIVLSRMATSKFDVNKFLGEELTVDNLSKLIKAELKIVAQTLNVDVTGCSRKAEILDAIVTHEGFIPRAPAATSDNTAQNESNPISEINLEKARVELQERKDRLKANKHDREMEKDRLNVVRRLHTVRSESDLTVSRSPPFTV